MTEILATARLALRLLTPGDLPFIAGLLGDAEVMRHWPRPFSPAEAADWIERQRERYARDGIGYWLALDRASGQPVGQAGLLVQEYAGVRHVGLGYMLARSMWGRGLALEAARACAEYALARLGEREVVSLIRPENVRSQRVTLRAGFLPESFVRYADLPHLAFVRRRSEASLSAIAAHSLSHAAQGVVAGSVDSDRWARLWAGEGCALCPADERPHRIARLDASVLTAPPSACLRGYCCAVYPSHRTELHALSATEAVAFVSDVRRISGALQRVTGARKINLLSLGNLVPHLHVHVLPRLPGDRFEGRAPDPGDVRDDLYGQGEHERFIGALRAELDAPGGS